MPAYIPELEFAQVEVGPEYELRDLSSLCHCRQGMAPLMPDCADGLVDRIQENPQKVLLPHLIVFEALSHIVLPDRTVLCL